MQVFRFINLLFLPQNVHSSSSQSIYVYVIICLSISFRNDDHDVWLSLYWYVSFLAFDVNVRARCMLVYVYTCIRVLNECQCVYVVVFVCVLCMVRNKIWLICVHSFSILFVHNSIPQKSISFYHFIYFFGFLLFYEKKNCTVSVSFDLIAYFILFWNQFYFPLDNILFVDWQQHKRKHLFFVKKLNIKSRNMNRYSYNTGELNKQQSIVWEEDYNTNDLRNIYFSVMNIKWIILLPSPPLLPMYSNSIGIAQGKCNKIASFLHTHFSNSKWLHSVFHIRCE